MSASVSGHLVPFGDFYALRPVRRPVPRRALERRGKPWRRRKLLHRRRVRILRPINLGRSRPVQVPDSKPVSIRGVRNSSCSQLFPQPDQFPSVLSVNSCCQSTSCPPPSPTSGHLIQFQVISSRMDIACAGFRRFGSFWRLLSIVAAKPPPVFPPESRFKQS